MKEIELTQGKIAIVDDEDYEYLSKWKWCAEKIIGSHSENYYAKRRDYSSYRKSTIRMHREIMKFPEFLFVDHINGNGLDNRKENLRICTRSENIRNQSKQKNNFSGYKGVIQSKTNGKYLAKICVNNKNIHIGTFDSKYSAAIAYDIKAIELFGEFANLNFPERSVNEY